jgi:RNA polymerase sigma factor (sigma-70 family)
MREKQPHIVADLFRRYGNDIRAYFRRRLGRKEDVEDMVQETLLRAQRTPNWDTIENPKAYLMQTAGNLFRDHLRKEQRDEIDPSVDLADLEIASGDLSPENLTVLRSEYQHLCQAIEQLTPKVQKAILLNKFLNLSYAEVAQAMGISYSTVEKHIAKGMAECQRLLQEKDISNKNIISINNKQINAD